MLGPASNFFVSSNFLCVMLWLKIWRGRTEALERSEKNVLRIENFCSVFGEINRRNGFWGVSVQRKLIRKVSNANSTFFSFIK